METFECVICNNIVLEWGNDPWPIADEGVCCDACNNKFVIPARLAQLANQEGVVNNDRK